MKEQNIESLKEAQQKLLAESELDRVAGGRNCLDFPGPAIPPICPSRKEKKDDDGSITNGC